MMLTELIGDHHLPSSTLLLSSPLLSLNRSLLTLILQCLPWLDKLLHASHVSRLLPPLQSIDFLCTDPRGLVISHPSRYGAQSSQEISVSALLRASPHALRRVRRLLCHTPSLHILDGESRADESRRMLDACLTLFLASAPDEVAIFRRLHSLELYVGCDMELLFDRLFPLCGPLPSLTSLDVRAAGQADMEVDSSQLAPLRRLRALRSLRMSTPMTVPAFFLLCALPLHVLHLEQCTVYQPTGDWLVERPVVGNTWRKVYLPLVIPPSERLQRHRRPIVDPILSLVLSSYVQSCTEAAAKTDPEDALHPQGCRN